MPMLLKMHPDLEEKLAAHAKAAWPEEGCGLLLGSYTAECITIDEIALSANVTAGDPCNSFEVDPTLYLALHKASRAGAAAVIGVWHSHPSGVAAPSGTDSARSVQPGWVWLITATDGTKAHTNAFLAGTKDPTSFTPLVRG